MNTKELLILLEVLGFENPEQLIKDDLLNKTPIEVTGREIKEIKGIKELKNV